MTNTSPYHHRELASPSRASWARPEFFARHSERLRLYFRRRLGDDVEDEIQCAWTFLLSKLDADVRPEDVSAYLFGIARNIVSRTHRRRRRQDASLQKLRAHDPFASPPELARLESAPDLHRMEQQLAKLPEELRAVLWLQYWEGLSGHEISRQLQIPTNTVYSRSRAAKARLRAVLEPIQARADHRRPQHNGAPTPSPRARAMPRPS